MVGPYLLDLNLLLALVDSNHLHRQIAMDWFEETGHRHWMTCPLTEIGVVQVASGASYPGGPWDIHDVMESLKALRTFGRHSFVPHELSMFESGPFLWDNVRSSLQSDRCVPACHCGRLWSPVGHSGQGYQSQHSRAWSGPP